MNDFLNPKSMVTPGMAGALVMFLSNAVCFQFPEVAPRWAALLLSFALGGFVIAAAKLRYLQAAGFWLINSLIIFAVAAGSAGVAAKSTGAVSTGATALANFFVPSAVAQPVPASTAAMTKAQLQAQLEAANTRLAAQQQQLVEAQNQAANAAAQAHQALAQHQALLAQQAQENQKAKQAASQNANRFFKVW
ncbi:MAG: hypothetical protein WA803_09065 [Steroidobacteraceae bacterium]